MLLAEHAQLQLDDKDMNTLLLDTIRKRDPEHVRLLLDLGVDVSGKDKNGKSALFHACATGHAEMVECLVRSGANVNIVNRHNENALFQTHLFAGDFDVSILQTFLDADVDVTGHQHDRSNYSSRNSWLVDRWRSWDFAPGATGIASRPWH